jgi:hypothetical protein
MSVRFGEMEETLPVGQKIKQVKKDIIAMVTKKSRTMFMVFKQTKNYQIKR